MHGADPYKANTEGTTCYDMAWHNSKLRDWVSQLGVGEGTGVSGSGSFFISNFGEQPVVALVGARGVAMAIKAAMLRVGVVVMAKVAVVVAIPVVVMPLVFVRQE
jgi:hypothetical protein